MAARILVVEDNPLNLALVCAVLEPRGHQLETATTTDEARARLRERAPDLVLMDVYLPGDGGEVLLAEIRATPALAGLPVVAVTALAMDGDRERLLAIGFDGYLSKPIDTRTFAAAIEAFLR